MTDEKTPKNPASEQDRPEDPTSGRFTAPASPPDGSGREAEQPAVNPEQPAVDESSNPESEPPKEDPSTPLALAEAQRDEYLDLAQRTKAEFENYRKRLTGELAAAKSRGTADLAGGLISVLDNLERALEAAEIDPAAALAGETEVDGAMEQGVALTYRELCGALNRVGVEGFSPAGEKFDPTWHEAIQSMPGTDHESGTVVEVLQKGYRLEDRLLRPARVIVSA